MTTTDDATTLVREITIHAPAARIFAALTEPEQLVQWWGDDTMYHVRAMERDLRVGGRWQTTGEMADGTPFTVEGIYRVIEPPRLLEYTWHPNWVQRAGLPDTVVRVELQERAGGTLVRVTHSGFTELADKQSHDLGWARVLEWLHKYIAP